MLSWKFSHESDLTHHPWDSHIHIYSQVLKHRFSWNSNSRSTTSSTQWADPEAFVPQCVVMLTLVTQCPLEAWQTVTLSRDVVTWSVAMDALWTGLAAAVTKITGRADCSRTRRDRRRLSYVVQWWCKESLTTNRLFRWNHFMLSQYEMSWIIPQERRLWEIVTTVGGKVMQSHSMKVLPVPGWILSSLPPCDPSLVQQSDGNHSKKWISNGCSTVFLLLWDLYILLYICMSQVSRYQLLTLIWWWTKWKLDWSSNKLLLVLAMWCWCRTYSSGRWCLCILEHTHTFLHLESRRLRSYSYRGWSSLGPSGPLHTHCHSGYLHSYTRTDNFLNILHSNRANNIENTVYQTEGHILGQCFTL